MRRKLFFYILYIGLSFLSYSLMAQSTTAVSEGMGIPFTNIEITPPSNNAPLSFSIQLLLILTILSLAPSIILLMSSFLRISIVLDIVRRALTLQNMPPNSIIFGLSLFLTVFIMWQPLEEVYQKAYVPFSEGTLDLSEFYDVAKGPIRYFMYKQMRNSNFEEIKLFMRLANLSQPENFSQVPSYILIPAFVLHELTIAFKIGVLIFLPFIIIDMVIASILMAMGMIMLPPMMISLPFKLILFVLIDGWTLISSQLMESFL